MNARSAEVSAPAPSGRAVADAFRGHPHLHRGRARRRDRPAPCPSSWSSLRRVIWPSIRTLLVPPPSPGHCMSATTVLPETLNEFIVQSPSARFLTISSGPFFGDVGLGHAEGVPFGEPAGEDLLHLLLGLVGHARRVELEQLERGAVLARLAAGPCRRLRRRLRRRKRLPSPSASASPPPQAASRIAAASGSV